MENKYYTPTIEEFYVGFEFEYLKNNKWKTSNNFVEELTEWDIEATSTVEYKIEDNEVRVKYLDRQDIESLNWIYETTNGIRTWYSLDLDHLSGVQDYFKYKCYGAILNHDTEMKLVHIYFDFEGGMNLNNYNEHNSMVELNVKNKSELIKVMKQLNIK